MVLMNVDAVTCSWVDTSPGRVGTVEQEGTSAGILEVCIAQVGMKEVDMAQDTLVGGKVQGTLVVGKAQGTLVVGKVQVSTQEVADRAACTAAAGKTCFLALEESEIQTDNNVHSRDSPIGRTIS